MVSGSAEVIRMSSSDDSSQPQATRMILDMRRHVQQIRNQFWSEGVDGGFSPRTKRELAKVAIQYWDMLYEFRSESILDEGDFPDITPVRSRLGKQTEVVTKSKRLGQSTTVKSVPAITELSDWYLVELTEDLDDLAKKLGFGAKATSGKGELYSIKRDPEDYDDPVSDDVPKPK